MKISRLSIPLIDLRPAHKSLESKIFAVLRSVYRRNAYILGEEVRLFEKEFAALCGVPHAVGVSSGTAALTLTLRALGIGSGDEVITTPFTFFATASAIAETGARPRFADIDPGTWNLDPNKLEPARSARTRAVLPVHLFGQPAEMDSILRFARRHSLKVVEDACQAHGAVYRGRPVGSWGAAGCFSFYPSKNLGALGDAGMIGTKDARLADRLRVLRNCGRRNAPYRHEELGYVARLDNLQAAVLRVKMRRLGTWNRQRRVLAEFYRNELTRAPVRFQKVLTGSRSAYHLFTIRAPRRGALQSYLAARGIGTGIFYQTPLHLQRAFAYLKYQRGDFPESEKAAREALSLPLYPGLDVSDAHRVVRAIIRFYRG